MTYFVPLLVGRMRQVSSLSVALARLDVCLHVIYVRNCGDALLGNQSLVSSATNSMTENVNWK